jgi:hypothetical protein
MIFDVGSATPKLFSKSFIKKVHLVKYQWNKSSESIDMQYYERELMQTFTWAPDNINISVAGPRKCIGFYLGDRYFPCIIHSYVDEFPQCLRCVSHSIPYVKCIFEPECYGDKCPGAICSKPHIVYLAFFNTHYKIGLSSENRFKLRITEQGADAYSIISKTKNRLEARELEKNISRILRIKQAFEPEELLKTFTEQFREKIIYEKYELLSKSFKNRFGLNSSDLIFIENYPLELPLRSTPKLQETKKIHQGKYLGIKGKYLIYDSKGLNALKMDEMLGNFVTFQSD